MLLPSLIGVATVLSTLVSGLPVAVPQSHEVSLHPKRDPPLMPLNEVLIASQASFKREAAPEPLFGPKTASAVTAAKERVKTAASKGKVKAKAKAASGKAKAKDKGLMLFGAGMKKVYGNVPRKREAAPEPLFGPKTASAFTAAKERIKTAASKGKVKAKAKAASAKEKAKHKGLMLSGWGMKKVYGNVPRKREAAPEPQFRMKAMSALGAAKDTIKIAAKQGWNKGKTMFGAGKAKTKSMYGTGKAKTKSAYTSGKAKTKSAYTSGKAMTKSAYASTKAQVKNLPKLPEDIVRKIYKDPRPPKTAKREAAPQTPITTPQAPKFVTEPVKKGAVDSKKKVPNVVQSAKRKMWYNMATSVGKATKREASPEPGTKIDGIKALIRPVKQSVVSSKQKVTSKVKEKYKAKKASRKSKKVDKKMAKWEAQRMKDVHATL
ncbi:hypothetical protein HYFRA_00007622 [Hymenoscyphus fraxineus]|uniref:Uncharacterized protein n=1 Tax=Hymenoscyphus fraxineus TaxID=746836 RepID=A0A9N9KU16_9HELO|nr:hypothetical protein HYFRA_00007622 [Hymenoscyphus fraxineus]